MMTSTHLTQRYAIATVQGRVTKVIVSPEARIACADFFTQYQPMLDADGTQVLVSSDLQPDDILFLGGPHLDDIPVH